jgi:hypothetical protein
MPGTSTISEGVWFMLLLLLATGLYWSVIRNTKDNQNERIKLMKKTQTKLEKAKSSHWAVSFVTTTWATLTGYCGGMLP